MLNLIIFKYISAVICNKKLEIFCKIPVSFNISSYVFN